jgi:ATP-dependent protease Clp ATPase subunit
MIDKRRSKVLEPFAECCSFCEKHKTKVKFLIKGPSAYICDECVLVCVEVLEHEASEISKKAEAEKKKAAPSTPTEGDKP